MSGYVQGYEPEHGDAVVEVDDDHVAVAGRDLTVVGGVHCAASLERTAVDIHLKEEDLRSKYNMRLAGSLCWLK